MPPWLVCRTGVTRSLGESLQAAEVSGDAHAPAGMALGRPIRSTATGQRARREQREAREACARPSTGSLRQDGRGEGGPSQEGEPTREAER